MTNYASGRRIEYKAMQKLRDDGATFVCRTAGSHSPFDVIALFDNPPHSLWIQCKAGTKKTINRERKNWIPPKTAPFHHPELWLWELGKGEFEIVKQED